MSKINRRNFMKLAGGTGAYSLMQFLTPSLAKASQSKSLTLTQESLCPQFKKVEQFCLTEKDDAYPEEPVIASDSNSNSWLAWLSRNTNGKESVKLCRNTNNNWQPAVTLTSQDGYYDSVRNACTKDNTPMVVWVENIDEAWLIQSTISNGSKFNKPVEVTSKQEGRASYPCLVADKKNFWLAWESYKNGKFHICLKRYTDNQWSNTIDITDGSSNTYTPAIAVDKAGTVWVAYSKAENGESNIYMKSYEPAKSKVSDEIPICISGGRAYQCSHPAVFCDDTNKVWVAWQRINDKKIINCRFGKSECWVACYHKGKLETIKAKQKTHGSEKAFAIQNNHRPAFLKDANGNLWLFSRQYFSDVTNLKISLEDRRTWKIAATMLDGENGWTPPIDIISKERLGRLGRTSVVLADKDHIWLTWQGDNIYEPSTKFLADLRSDVYAAKIKLSAPKTPRKKYNFCSYDCGKHAENVLGRRWVPRKQLTCNGRTYTLLYGNLHEHSNISRCANDGSDGTLDENYRYGIDVEGYDFVALTDHGYDMFETFWRQTRRAARFYNDPEHFIALPAYEWTKSTGRPGEEMFTGSGHRNVIFPTDQDAAKFINPETNYLYESRSTPQSDMPDKLWKLLREKNIKAITIPHHTADANHPMDFNYHDPEYQCVVEVYQIRRSSEHQGCPEQIHNVTKLKGCFVQDGLERGYKMGFVASGDHNSMGTGLAAVLVKEISPQGIVEALRARRCYATTGDKIFIDFRINGHLNGQEIQTSEKPHITAAIEAADELTDIVIFRDGKIIYQLDANQLKDQKNYNIDLTDDYFPGNSYYYLRLIQKNNQIAWSSPIWVTQA